MELFFADRKSWRRWLAKHRNREREVWLIFHKKHTGKHGISYDEAIDEALCFGWVDSLVKRLDDGRYLRKFTPRTNTGKWSAINLQRVQRLIKSGRMTKAGLAKLDSGVEPQTPPARTQPPMPLVFKQALARNARARENFQRLAPSHRRNYIAWIATAKRPETQMRRAREAVLLLQQNKKLGLK